jgi:hypothetical protein
MDGQSRNLAFSRRISFALCASIGMTQKGPKKWPSCFNGRKNPGPMESGAGTPSRPLMFSWPCTTVDGCALSAIVVDPTLRFNSPMASSVRFQKRLS